MTDRRNFLKKSSLISAAALTPSLASAAQNSLEPENILDVGEDLVIPPSRTFLGSPAASNLDSIDAEVAFLGIPNDQGTNTPWENTGQSQAPDIIRNFSPTVFLDIAEIGLYDCDDGHEHVKGMKMVDAGNVTTVGNDVERNFKRAELAIQKILDSGAMPVTFGGDHSNQIPIMWAYKNYGKPFDVIQFDAHLDFGKDMHGSPYSNNSNMYITRNLDYVENIYSLGIRHTFKQQWDEAKAAGFNILTARQMIEAPNREDLINNLIPSGRDVYITFDIDALDGNIYPGTTIPVPGGIDFYQTLDYLKAICKRCNVIGFDMMEIHPNNDHEEITSRLAGWIVARFLGYYQLYNKK